MNDINPWDALDLSVDRTDKTSELKRLEIKRRFRGWCNTPDGQWCLEYLNGFFLNKPVVDENAINPLAVAGIREGENRAIKFIHLKLQPEK